MKYLQSCLSIWCACITNGTPFLPFQRNKKNTFGQKYNIYFTEYIENKTKAENNEKKSSKWTSYV